MYQLKCNFLFRLTRSLKTNISDVLTGSLPSMASSHNLLLDSDSACSVMTPCLEGLKREAALSWIPVAWDTRKQRVYTARLQNGPATAQLQPVSLLGFVLHIPLLIKSSRWLILEWIIFCGQHAYTLMICQPSLRALKFKSEPFIALQ